MIYHTFVVFQPEANISFPHPSTQFETCPYSATLRPVPPCIPSYGHGVMVTLWPCEGQSRVNYPGMRLRACMREINFVV